MLYVFLIASFLGAALVFLVQPMAARALLPTLGGSPAVWNTSMVFFQAVLLAGYLYAHLLTRFASTKLQILIHIVVLASPIAAMYAIGTGIDAPGPEDSPTFWLLGALAMAVGLPFFTVTTAGPLLQRWFASTDHRMAADPYFLYAAGNAGSLLGLLAYPLILEPTMGLSNQARLWSFGYAAFAVSVVGAGVFMLRKHKQVPVQQAARADPPAPISHRRRAMWVLLAFVPSSLMLGTTQFLTTDIAAVPLLWVIPLAIYLLTFIIAFARMDVVRSSSRLLGIVAVVLALTFLLRSARPIWVLMGLHLFTLFLAGLLCHGRLAVDRPDPSRLTEFYLFIAIGGVLGGIFNALIAPLAFNSVAEYPIAIALVCLLRIRPDSYKKGGRRSLIADLALPLAVPVVALIAAKAIGEDLGAPGRAISGPSMVILGAAAAACYLFVGRPLRFGLAIGALLMMASLNIGAGDERPWYKQRTFFGVHSIHDMPVEELSMPIRVLWHGSTFHGAQNLERRQMHLPLGYYHEKAPIGRLLTTYADSPVTQDIALIGLGTGALAAYGQEGRNMTFYEIDPTVVKIATDPEKFTYISDSKATVDFKIGDGRLRLAEAQDESYGLIVLDAFSSDAIPVHLLTRQAFEMYLAKLRPGGIIAAHISNLHVDLEPVLAALADELALSSGVSVFIGTQDDINRGRFGCTWVVLARSDEDLRLLGVDSDWRQLTSRPGLRVWTDDFSNIWSVFRWRDGP